MTIISQEALEGCQAEKVDGALHQLIKRNHLPYVCLCTVPRGFWRGKKNKVVCEGEKTNKMPLQIVWAAARVAGA